MDRLSAMKIFARVAELESFTQTAEDLGVPKASVTVAVQELEEAVGARLLERTTRSVRLTPDGASYLERCRDLLNDLDETESMFRNEPMKMSGKIRVDMGIPMARHYVIPLLPQFLAQYPGIEIELSSTDQRVDVLREGFDAVIRGGNVSEPGLGERPLGATAFVNVVSASYIAQHGRPRSIEDLRSHYLVGYTQNWSASGNTFEYFDGEKYRDVRMKTKITVNNTDAYRAACVAGLGIAQIPTASVEEDLRAGTLVEILPKLQAEPMQIKIVYPLRRHMTQRVRVFLDWLEKAASAYDHINAKPRSRK